MAFPPPVAPLAKPTGLPTTFCAAQLLEKVAKAAKIIDERMFDRMSVSGWGSE